MLTAKDCRAYAAQSSLLSLDDTESAHTVHHLAMSIKWNALADQIEADDLRLAAAEIKDIEVH